MKLNIERYAPPGVNVKNELLAYMWCNILAVVYSMGFVFRYIDAFDRLYVYVNFERILNENAKIESFSDLIGNGFICFYIPVIAAAAFMVYHYIYHYQISKSIYVMKRLPKRTELFKRCVSLPVAAMIASVAVLIVTMLLYYGIYNLCTPKICLYDDMAIVEVWRET